MPIQSKFSDGNEVTTVGRYVHLNTSQKSDIETYKGYNWHVYEEWANSAPWVNNDDAVAAHEDPENPGTIIPAKAATTGKKYRKEEHVFQTIDMGSTGAFVFEAVTLAPQVILIDQHGWEIMRVPKSNTAELSKYNSPMVKKYYWYSTSHKIPGYHKYTVSDTPTYDSTSLDDTPSGDTDFYVTYDVVDDYARAYSGAATEAETSPSAYLLKQGDYYAKTDNGTTITTTTEPASMDNISENMQWYLRPNFNIDREMGYK